jgi:hypothetical protein
VAISAPSASSQAGVGGIAIAGNTFVGLAFFKHEREGSGEKDNKMSRLEEGQEAFFVCSHQKEKIFILSFFGAKHSY